MTNFFSWLAKGLEIEGMTVHKFFAYIVAILIVVAICYSMVKFIIWIINKVKKNEHSNNHNYYNKNRGR